MANARVSAEGVDRPFDEMSAARSTICPVSVFGYFVEIAVSIGGN